MVLGALTGKTRAFAAPPTIIDSWDYPDSQSELTAMVNAGLSVDARTMGFSLLEIAIQQDDMDRARWLLDHNAALPDPRLLANLFDPLPIPHTDQIKEPSPAMLALVLKTSHEWGTNLDFAPYASSLKYPMVAVLLENGLDPLADAGTASLRDSGNWFEPWVTRQQCQRRPDGLCYTFDVQDTAPRLKRILPAYADAALKLPAHPTIVLQRVTPLMGAAFKGDVQRVKDLLAKGALATDKDIYGWTALEWASAGEHPSRELITALCEAGCPITKTTYEMPARPEWIDTT